MALEEDIQLINKEGKRIEKKCQPCCVRSLHLEGQVEILLEVIQKDNEKENEGNKEKNENKRIGILREELKELQDKFDKEFAKNQQLQELVDSKEKEKHMLEKTISSVSSDISTLKETVIKLEKQLKQEQNSKDEKVAELEETLRATRQQNTILLHKASHLQTDLNYLFNLLHHKDIVVLSNIEKVDAPDNSIYLTNKNCVFKN